MAIQGRRSDDDDDVTREFTSKQAQSALAYVSHAPADESQAAKLVTTLESEGASCWVSNRDAAGSLPWPQSIIEAIESCPLFILVLTPAAGHSDAVFHEVELACERNRRILVLSSMGEVASPRLEFLLRSANWIPVENPISNEDRRGLVDLVLNFDTLSGLSPPASPTVPGMPSTGAQALLVRLDAAPDAITGRRLHELADGDRVVLGRSRDVDLAVHDHRASRRHAGLVARRDRNLGLQLHMMDLMSTNGTWVRYRRGGDPEFSQLLQHGSMPIYDGAIIRIGSTDIRINVAPIGTRVLRAGNARRPGA